MKLRLPFFLAIIILSSCSENITTCENKLCTEELVSVNVKFIDSNGNPLIVKDYESKNLRTGKLLKGANAIDTTIAKGFYAVASDGNLRELNSSDKVLISAKHPATNVLKQAEFTVSGGECECHVAKIAGPDEVKF